MPGHPPLLPRPDLCPVSVDALLGPAQLFGKGAFAASDLTAELQTLVQARHSGPPADEALGGLWDWGGWEDLQ